jgi:hypothetical protein
MAIVAVKVSSFSRRRLWTNQKPEAPLAVTAANYNADRATARGGNGSRLAPLHLLRRRGTDGGGMKNGGGLRGNGRVATGRDWRK